MYAGALDSSLLTLIVKIGNGIVWIVDKIGVGNLALAGVVAKVTSLISPAGKIYERINQLKDVFKVVKENAGDAAVLIAKIAQSNSEEATRQIQRMAQLLRLDAQRLTTKAQAAELTKLQGLLDDKQIAQAGELVALENARNAAISGRRALQTFGLSIAVALLPTIIGWLGDIQTRLAKVSSEAEQQEQTVDSIKNKIKDINTAIQQSGGLITRQQKEDLEAYNLELAIAVRQLEELRQEQTRLINKSSDETGYMGYSVSHIRFKDADKNVFDAYSTDLKDILGESETLTKETYDRLLSYLGKNKSLIDMVLSLDRDSLDENAQTIYDMFVKMREMAAEYGKEMKKTLTAGVTEETITLALTKAIEEIENLGYATDNLDALTRHTFDNLGLYTKQGEQVFHDYVQGIIDDVEAQQIALDSVSRSLKDYISLYDQATNGLSAQNILDIVENWSEYADVLQIENGELSISKDLVVAKAQAVVDGQIKALKSHKTEIENQMAALLVRRQEIIIENEITNDKITNSALIIKATNKVTEAYKQRNLAAAGETNLSLPDERTLDSAYSQISKIDSTIATLLSDLENTEKQIKYLEGLKVEDYLKKAATATKKAGSAAKSATKATSEANEELKKLQALLKALNDQLNKTSEVYKKVQSEMKKMVEEEKDGIEELNDGLEENIKYYEARVKLVQEALKKQIDAIKAEQKAAEEANDAAQKAIDARIKALKEETKTFEKNNKAQQDAIDEQVKALEEQIKAIDDANKSQEDALKVQEKLLEIEKARLALEKSKDAYEQAKKNKTVRTYDAQTGWTYTADQSLVQSAYADYTSAQSSYDDLLKEYAEMMAEAEREAQKAAIQAQIDALKDQKEGLQALLEQTKEAAEAEEENLNAQKDILKEQKEEIKNNFQATLDKLDNQSDNLGDISDNVEKAVDKYLNDAEVQDWYNAYMNASEEERVEMMRALEGLWKTNLEQQNSNEEEIERLDKLIEEIDKMLDVDDYQVSTSEGVKEWLEDFKQVTYEDRRAMVSEMRDAYAEFYTSQQAQIEKVQEAIDKIEGNVNITTQLLKHWGTGTHNTPINNYANGGVVDSGILSHTGMLGSNVKVHGTPQSPELILNGRQQANLLYRLAKQAPTGTTINNNGSNGSMYIANLNIQADSNDTLKGLLIQAKQLASIS